jgi:hypothetical protein
MKTVSNPELAESVDTRIKELRGANKSGNYNFLLKTINTALEYLEKKGSRDPTFYDFDEAIRMKSAYMNVSFVLKHPNVDGEKNVKNISLAKEELKAFKELLWDRSLMNESEYLYLLTQYKQILTSERVKLNE